MRIESGGARGANGKLDLRSLSIAKLRALDFDTRVPGLGLIPDFSADMLPLAITVGPDEQGLAVSGLVPDILRYWQFVLSDFSTRQAIVRCLLRTLSTVSCTGASNKDPGGHDNQPLYWRSKSRPVR